MRNLKRVLSLTLASVMLLGMMVVGASAADKKTFADLTDSADVKNQEAVSLMVDLGIITGKPDGSYAPAQTVDRATMAKLITFIMMGDVDQNSFKGTATNLTDVSGNWAEGYIKYCYSNGIISGDGAGHFFPTQPVTVVAAAKMLLVALGYDAKDRGYENDANWSVNIMRDAQSTKEGSAVRALTKGLNVKATDALSRDNAAQMIFNALFVHTVKPEYAFDMGQRYIAKYNEQGSMAEISYGGLYRQTATLTAVENGKVNGGVLDGLAASSSDLGKTVVYYTSDKAGTKLVSKAVVAGGTSVLASSNDGTAIADIVTDKKLTLNTKPGATENDPAVEDVLYYVNGKEAASKTAAETAADRNGALVEFIDSKGEGKVTVIRVTAPKVATVGKINTRVVNKKTQVSIGGVCGYVDEAKVPGYENLKEDDIVLYYDDNDGVYHIEKAESIEGKISSKNSKNQTVTINGTAYAVSELEDATFTWAGATDFKNEFSFYLDNYDNIVLADQITEEKTSSYAVVLKAVWVDGSGAIGESQFAQAQLLHTDGTTEIVTVAAYNAGPDAQGDPTDDVKLDTETKFNTADIAEGSFYSYTEGKNGITLTAVDNTEVTGNKATTPGKEGAIFGLKSTEKTIFIVETEDKDGKAVYTVYTGIDNVPNGTTAATDAGQAIVGTNFTSHVYVKMTLKAAKDNAMYVFVADASAMDEGSDNKIYHDVYVDGVKEDLVVEKAGSLDSNKLYQVRLTDGVVEAADIKLIDTVLGTEANGVKTLSKGGNITALEGGVATITGITNGVRYNSSTDVYLFELELDQTAQNPAVKFVSGGVASLSKTPTQVVGQETTATYSDVVYVFETEEGSQMAETVIIIRTTTLTAS